MNKYFGTATAKSSRQVYEKNKTLAAVRVAIMQNKAMCLGTSNPEKWHTILRDEFPNVPLRIDEEAVYINEKQSK
jgi:hypothetical protein